MHPVRRVIERMLIPRGSFGIDHLYFSVYLQMIGAKEPDETTLAALESFKRSEYMQRVIGWYFGLSDEPPWPGIKWVLRLIPDNPKMALNTLEAFFVAHMNGLSDGMIYALDSAESVIRARYIGVPESAADRVRLLLDLTSRQFEQIVEHLYSKMDYETELTSPSADGGRDIIATSLEAGRREHLLIECKRYFGKVRIQTVRALIGTVSTELATKGVLVTTADFTRGERELESLNHRIELISGPQLVLLLNAHLGNTWPAHIEYLTRERPIRSTDITPTGT